eukprot:scaffold24387_cov60-Phaeocystis_antarctica.AAC.1
MEDRLRWDGLSGGDALHRRAEGGGEILPGGSSTENGGARRGCRDQVERLCTQGLGGGTPKPLEEKGNQTDEV